jgi:hypothetical protein
MDRPQFFRTKNLAGLVVRYDASFVAIIFGFCFKKNICGLIFGQSL